MGKPLSNLAGSCFVAADWSGQEHDERRWLREHAMTHAEALAWFDAQWADAVARGLVQPRLDPDAVAEKSRYARALSSVEAPSRTRPRA